MMMTTLFRLSITIDHDDPDNQSDDDRHDNMMIMTIKVILPVFHYGDIDDVQIVNDDANDRDDNDNDDIEETFSQDENCDKASHRVFDPPRQMALITKTSS